MRKDITTKEAVKAITEDIALYILGFEVKDVEFVDKELLRIEKREADVVATCLIKDKPSILHLEIQNSNDHEMIYRMLRYRLDIMNIYKDIPIYQYVVYIGKNSLCMNDTLKLSNLEYSYNIVDMHNIDCETLIAMDNPDALVLAILCDFKNKSEKDVLLYILKRLAELTDNNMNSLKKYTQMLETLSENRNLKKALKEAEEMLSNIAIEQLPSYELGMERGMERGIEQKIQEIITNSISLGLDENLISKLTGLSVEEIKKYIGMIIK